MFAGCPSGWAPRAGGQAGLHHIALASLLPGGLTCGVALVLSPPHPAPASSSLLSVAFLGFQGCSRPPGFLRSHRYFNSCLAAPPRAFAYQQMLGTHKHRSTPGTEHCLSRAAPAQSPQSSSRCTRGQVKKGRASTTLVFILSSLPAARRVLQR